MLTNSAAHQIAEQLHNRKTQTMAANDLGSDKELQRLTSALLEYLSLHYTAKTSTAARDALAEILREAPARGMSDGDDELPDDVTEEAATTAMSLDGDDFKALGEQLGIPTHEEADEYARSVTR